MKNPDPFFVDPADFDDPLDYQEELDRVGLMTSNLYPLEEEEDLEEEEYYSLPGQDYLDEDLLTSPGEAILDPESAYNRPHPVG